MATFVLVHGACMGGIFWEGVAERLRKAGHQVFTPTLTGCAERGHLLTKDLGLETHVLDIVNLIKFHDLNEVVLVGHSYAGSVITQAAEHVKDRLASLVYVDALFPDDGKTTLSTLPQAAIDVFDGAVSAWGDGYKLIFTEPLYPVLNIKNETHLKWATKRLTPFPYRAFRDVLSLPTKAAESTRGLYILCHEPGDPAGAVCRPSADKAKGLGYKLVEIEAGHFPNLELPDETARILADFVA